MNAIFFNKIDNYLMALMGRGSVRQIFQKYWPDFLYEEPIELPDKNSPKKTHAPNDNIPEPITRRPSGSIINVMERQMSSNSVSNTFGITTKQAVNGMYSNVAMSPVNRTQVQCHLI